MRARRQTREGGVSGGNGKETRFWRSGMMPRREVYVESKIDYLPITTLRGEANLRGRTQEAPFPLSLSSKWHGRLQTNHIFKGGGREAYFELGEVKYLCLVNEKHSNASNSHF